MTNINNSATQSKPDPLPTLDLRIAMARKRLARLEAERNREGSRRFGLCKQHILDSDIVGDRLWRRLCDMAIAAQHKLAELEAERAAALLAGIDALAGADE